MNPDRGILSAQDYKKILRKVLTTATRHPSHPNVMSEHNPAPAMQIKHNKLKET
jgi:hypothetical protein